jgi:hypothetical protein
VTTLREGCCDYYYYMFIIIIIIIITIVHTQLVKKFPAFYGTQGLITVFTKSRHWSLSRVR